MKKSFPPLKERAKLFARRVLPTVVERLEDVRYAGLPVPFRMVRPHTLLSNLNLFFLTELTRRLEVETIPGDFVECGVYRGGSAGILGHAAMHSATRRRLRLFDAFAGMPKASKEDDAYSHSIAGDFLGSEAQTRRILNRLGVPADRFEIAVGWFEDTLPLQRRSEVALLHVDCDFHDPVGLTLETFYPDVVPGGFVVFNDYGSFKGCRTAADKFLRGLDVPVGLTQIDQDAYYFQKPRVS